MTIDNLELVREFTRLLSDGYVHMLLMMIIFDIATGFVKSLIRSELNSTKGLTGLIKHLLVVMLVLVAYPYLRLFGLNDIASCFIVFYIIAYAISIVENWCLMGLPFPKFAKDYLYKLKGIADSGSKPTDKK